VAAGRGRGKTIKKKICKKVEGDSKGNPPPRKGGEKNNLETQST